VVTATANVKLGRMHSGTAREPPIRRFTADEAMRMSEAGILRDDEHFELLDGEFVDSNPETGEPFIRRFTGDEAIRLVELGIVGQDEHVELLDGALVEMSPQSAQHSAAVRRLAKRLRQAFGERAEVFEEKPLAASPHDLPEPDLAVVRPREDGYSISHPTGHDAILVVEVAWSSHSIDRRKAAIFAKAGVPVYWLLDIASGRLEVRAELEDGAYGATAVLREDDSVALPESSERWPVRDLLPTK
jgi:Uma2 family endonuclease